MKIDIYTSAVNGSKHLSVLKGVKLDSLVFAADVDTDILSLSPFKTRLDLDLKREHDALEHVDVLQQIEEKGYAIHSAKFLISLSAAK
ncbi:MAG: hypothetical protein ACI92E_000347 [Oceanicoccus sp.]|jgi:hypothetical protein